MRDERASTKIVDSSFAAAREQIHRGSAVPRRGLMGALGAGLLAAVAGAFLWAFVTVLTGHQAGFMAIGVGLIVGWAVCFGGKGAEPLFGVVGAGLALLGCAGGKLLSVYARVARETEEPFFELLTELEWGLAWELTVSYLSPVDLLFFAIAVYEGYRFSLFIAAAESR